MLHLTFATSLNASCVWSFAAKNIMQFTISQISAFLFFFGALFTILNRTRATSSPDEHIVQLKSGPVRGGSQMSIFGLDLEQFLGIPYAAAPVGDLRFAPPQPVQPWKEVRDGTKYGARCPQNDESYPRNYTTGRYRADTISY